jgi:spore coat polysaccharide biosynthesis predicted glycosyltransferase SpsG
VNLIHDPESVRDLMVEVDHAISAAGQTLDELAATDTPTVTIQVAETQAGNLKFMQQHGVISPIRFENQNQLEADLFDTLSQLFTQPERRTEMAANGVPLVDGKWDFRCAKILGSSLTQICPNPGTVTE